ncbi:Spherulin-1A 1 [Madurella fahalii]|uniref:Spherulin-1A 1 n=1 Tax=Madurella fahalii TaxID=1157608 RepID=A0ABQ0GP61_9PEZI
MRFTSVVAIVIMTGCSAVLAAPGASSFIWSESTIGGCETSELSSTTSEPLSKTSELSSTTSEPLSKTSELLSNSPPASTDAPVLSDSSIIPTQTSIVSSIPTGDGLSLIQQLLLADTSADRFDLLPDDEQFVFDFNQPQEGAGDDGSLIVANRKTFPALIGTGAGMAVGHVGPCGLNTFHVHPRSAELQLVVSGRLVTEMVPENGVFDGEGNRRVIRNEVGPFQMTPFYQGSIHTQFNPDCADVIFVASFTSEDFGTGQVLDETLAFTDDVIAAAFGHAIAGKDIDAVREAIPINITLSVEECLQQCGIEKRTR